VAKTIALPGAINSIEFLYFGKSKNTVPISGRRNLYVNELLIIPHCEDNRLTDGRYVILTQRPRSALQDHQFYCF
jgi:hypothetical protein